MKGRESKGKATNRGAPRRKATRRTTKSLRQTANDYGIVLQKYLLNHFGLSGNSRKRTPDYQKGHNGTFLFNSGQLSEPKVLTMAHSSTGDMSACLPSNYKMAFPLLPDRFVGHIQSFDRRNNSLYSPYVSRSSHTKKTV